MGTLAHAGALSVAMFGMNKLSDFPCMSSKAHHALEIADWLAVKMSHVGDELRKAFYCGCSAFFLICRRGSQWLTHAEKLEMQKARDALLWGYKGLAERAFSLGKCRLPFRPKLHQIDEAFQTAKKNRLALWQ